MDAVERAIAATGHRVAVGFKPAGARHGEGLDKSTIQDLVQRGSERLQRLGAKVKKRNPWSTGPSVEAVLPAGAIAALRAEPEIDYVEPDTPLELLDCPGPNVTPQTYPNFASNVDASGAWTTNRGAGVKVAILDSGVPAHVDIAGGIVGSVDCGGSGSLADTNGHATGVAGVLAARDNGLGIVGVAPDVQLLVAKISDAQGLIPMSAAKCGIDWAIANGAKVINMSWGSTIWSSYLAESLEAAYGQGIVLVAAVGNSYGDGVLFPAQHPYVIGVGGLYEAGRGGWESGIAYSPACSLPRDRCPEVMAQGYEVNSALINACGYGLISGTSYASPAVAGIAAILHAQYPAAAPQELRFRIAKSATDITASTGGTSVAAPGWDAVSGYGRANAPAALLASNGSPNGLGYDSADRCFTAPGVCVGQCGEVMRSCGSTTYCGPCAACAETGSRTTTDITGSGASLSWAGVTGAQSYDVYYRATGTSTWGFAGNTGGLALSLSGLSGGTSYEWYVKTRCGVGYDPSSTTVTTATFTTVNTCTGPDVALIPAMTSNTAPSGVAVASSVYLNSSSYAAWKAFDSSGGTVWLSDDYVSSAYLQYNWNDGYYRVVHSYQLVYGNGSCCEQRGPRDWTLQGWNGSYWVVVDTVTGQSGWYANPIRTFTVASPGPYLQYRLQMTEDNYAGSPAITMLSVGGFQLFGSRYTCCIHRTCSQLGVSCGLTDDGCGTQIDCGQCPTCNYDGICDWNEDPTSCPSDCCGGSCCVQTMGVKPSRLCPIP